MNKQCNYMPENQEDESVNCILEMMWDDNITDEELDKMLLEVKDKSLVNKLARYQYAKDVLNDHTKTGFFNIIPRLDKKLDEIHKKAKLKNHKQNLLYKAYNNTIKNRSIFWPFSLTAIAVYSLFFTFLSLNNKTINSLGLNLVKTEIVQNKATPKFIDGMLYSLMEESDSDYTFINIGEMNLKYDKSDISNVNNRPKKILTQNKADILKL